MTNAEFQALIRSIQSLPQGSCKNGEPSPLGLDTVCRLLFAALTPSVAQFVTPFQYVSVPTAQTQGPGLVTFMTVPVTVLTAGDILITFSASVEVLTVAPGSANFQGANFGFLWDGAVIPPRAPSVTPQNSFMEHDDAGVQASPDSFSNQINLRDVVVGALPGPHTLEVQFEGIDALSEVHVFDGSGSITVQSAPL